MPKYEIIRSYMVSEVYHIIADDEEHAHKQACQFVIPEYDWHQSYESEYDDVISVRLLEEEPTPE